MDSPFGSQCDSLKETGMAHTKKGDKILQAVRIGLDIAKSSFQVHGVAAPGKVVLRKQLTRGKVRSSFAQLPRCLMGLEAWGGAPDGARELQTRGHEVRRRAVALLQP
jgi:transposase